MEMLFALVVCATALLAAEGVQVVRHQSEISTEKRANAPSGVREVVEMLQTILDDSKKEGESERELYAKYKCYCDDNQKLKEESIASLTKEIGLLENQVTGLQASNGALSIEVAALQKGMDENTQAQDKANALREEQLKSFQAEEADLTTAIDQMTQALEILSNIGADQTLQASAAHSRFMAGYKPNSANLLKLQSSVSKALGAASAFLSPQQLQHASSTLLQQAAPFNEVYVASSGGVVGVLKSMKETFSANLETAQKNEAAAVKAHAAFIETKKGEYDTMKTSFDEKGAALGTNDGDIATKKTLLQEAIQQKADDEDFLAKLEEMCKAKAEDYEKRTMLRADEQAALSKAIAVLNSDHAYQTLEKAKVSFLQESSRKAKAASQENRDAAERYLEQAASSSNSNRLRSLLKLLRSGEAGENPFHRVFSAIEAMKATIEKEAKEDAEQKAWCEKEREIMNGNIEAKTGEITELNSAITTLVASIEDPSTGLLVMIAADEMKLQENLQAQTEETATRREETKAYQEEVANLVEAQKVVKKGIQILAAYYKAEDDKLRDELGLVQRSHREDPAPPETWTGEYVGQSKAGNEVISILEYILTDLQKSEASSHSTEEASQQAYEDSMTDLKKEEIDTKEALAGKQKTLAETKLELVEKRDLLAKTEEEKLWIERYLEKIKPGCDFIVDNYSTRESNRATEADALDKAVTLLKGTPAYVSATAKEEELKMGACASVCKVSPEKADCKACLAEVTVPGYCAGHPSTPGC